MKKIFLLCSFIFITQLIIAQTQFQYRIGSTYYDIPHKVIQTQDGNFLIAGRTDGFGSAGNAFILKVNLFGNILWVKDYSGINVDEIYDVIELADSRLVMCGSTNSYGEGALDAFVMVADSTGNMIWARPYGSYRNEYFSHIVEDGANGFYIGGSVQDSIIGNMNSALLRLDYLGNIMWAKQFNSPSFGYNAITPISTGGVIIGTYSSSGISLFLWKFDAFGNLVWSHNYTPTMSTGYLHRLSMLENSNGEILFNFNADNSVTVAHSTDQFILKVSSAGSIISAKSYGSTYFDMSSTISKTSDGGIIMCGQTNSAGNGGDDACLIKIRNDGSVQWAKAYGTVWNEDPANALQTADDGYIMTGQTWNMGTNNDSSKIYLVKTDSLGNASCNDVSFNIITNNHTVGLGTAPAPINITLHNDKTIDWDLNNRYFHSFAMCNLITGLTPVSETQCNIYPNPFSSTTNVEINAHFEKATFEIFSLIGQSLMQVELGSTTTLISRENLADGIYLYQIVGDGKIIDRGKIMIQ